MSEPARTVTAISLPEDVEKMKQAWSRAIDHAIDPDLVKPECTRKRVEELAEGFRFYVVAQGIVAGLIYRPELVAGVAAAYLKVLDQLRRRERADEYLTNLPTPVFEDDR